jgi:hypothetical protein
MVEDKVYSMFITYVFHSVDTIAKINTIFNNYFLSVCAYRARSGGLKSVEKPRLTARSKERRLAAGLTVRSQKPRRGEISIAQGASPESVSNNASEP